MKGLANKIKEAFDNIEAEPELVEATRQFLSDGRGKKIRYTFYPVFRMAMAAAWIFAAVVLGTGGYSWLKAPVSYVGIDVNPSIELALNRFDKVVSVKAYNAEGMEVLKGLSLKGKSYTDAIDIIVESKEMGVYLVKGAEIVFTVAAEGGRGSGLKSGVESCAGHLGQKSQSISVDMDAATNAHGYGISLGKYYAWQKLLQYGETVTVDDCKDMSMSELHGLISEHEREHQTEGHGDESHTEPEGHTQEDSYTEPESHTQEDRHAEPENHQQESHVQEQSQLEPQGQINQEHYAEEKNIEHEGSIKQESHKEKRYKKKSHRHK